MAKAPKKLRLLKCGEHGDERPWYVVCCHVYEGTSPTHKLLPPDESGVGEAICADCASHNPDIKKLIAVCDKCTETIILPRANADRN